MERERAEAEKKREWEEMQRKLQKQKQLEEEEERKAKGQSLVQILSSLKASPLCDTSLLYIMYRIYRLDLELCLSNFILD